MVLLACPETQLDAQSGSASEPCQTVPPNNPIATRNLSRHRILYAVGPGDVVGQCRNLLEGKEPPFQLGMSFSQQFLDVCEEAGAAAHLISCHGRKDRLQYGKHLVENRPQPRWYHADGIKHYIGTVMYGLEIVAQAVRECATVVVIDSGTTRWFVLSLLGLFGIPVIPVLYSALWPMGFPPTRRIDRIILTLDAWFFRRVASATVCMSPELERQVNLAAHKPKGPMFQFRPQYREEFLRRVPPVPPPPFHPFNVLFLGRVEEFKGVFLILSMAERLETEMPGSFKWRIFGAGAASDRLQTQIRERNLAEFVHAGRMLPNEQSAMETLGWAHAMIVPTTSQFKEGLAMTAAECVLAGRPVVLSDVVPAWEILGEAGIKCRTDSVDSFVDSLKKLALDPAYYEKHRRATKNVQAQFYDRQQGVGNVILRAVAALR